MYSIIRTVTWTGRLPPAAAAGEGAGAPSPANTSTVSARTHHRSIRIGHMVSEPPGNSAFRFGGEPRLVAPEENDDTDDGKHRAQCQQRAQTPDDFMGTAAERKRGARNNRSPKRAAHRVERCETAPVHAVGAGDERCQRAQRANEALEERNFGAMT